MKPIVFFGVSGVLFPRGVVTTKQILDYMRGEGSIPDDAFRLAHILNAMGDCDFVCMDPYVFPAEMDPAVTVSKIQEVMGKSGFKGTVSGTTPRKMSSYRCNEIQWYFRDRFGVTPQNSPVPYVILYPDTVTPPGWKPFHEVRVVPTVGITLADVERAKKYFVDRIPSAT